jgi:hypothetical protein
MENLKPQLNNEKEIVPSKSAESLLNSLPNRSGNKIVEIGLDEGNDPLFFAKENNDVFVAESRESLIEKTQKIAEEIGITDKIKFQKLERHGSLILDMKESTADGVHSVAFLNGTVLNKSFAEISRVLKSGGKVAILVYESTIDENGQEKRLFKENAIEDALSKTNLIIDNKVEFWDPRHENKTKVNVYYLTKK